MSRKGFAAALLLAALSARAQIEVRPIMVVPSAPGALAIAPAAAPSAAPALTAAPFAALSAPAPLAAAAPALAAVPAPAAAAAVPAAEAAPAAAPALTPQAHAAAMSGALGEFGRMDLGAAASGDAREAGDRLMARALGETAAETPSDSPADDEFPLPPRLLAPSTARPRTYLLSRPLREKVRLGPVALAGHVALEVGWEAFKAWLAWKATHSAAAVGVLLLIETPASPAMITFRSLVDLGQRYWRRKLAVLRELARVPGVEHARVLTTGEVKFMGPLARSKANSGLIFLESSSELPAEVGRFGAPIPIADVAAARVRLTLVKPDGSTAPPWTPSLSHLLEGRPIPPGAAAAWRAALSPGKAPIKVILAAAKSAAQSATLHADTLRVEAALLGADGSEQPLGAIVEGPAVRTLIGMGRLDRARAWAGWARAVRRLPISDTRVERPGDERPEGFLAGLTRAWRRLTGRLIVAQS
jgi:hypothetical protein